MPATRETLELAERRLARAQIAANKPGSTIDADLQLQQARAYYYQVQYEIISSAHKSLERENRELKRRLERASGNDNSNKGCGKPVRRAGNRNTARKQADQDWAVLTAADSFRSADPEDDQPEGQGSCMGGAVRAFRDGKPAYRAEKRPDRRSKRPVLQLPGLGAKAG